MLIDHGECASSYVNTLTLTTIESILAIELESDGPSGHPFPGYPMHQPMDVMRYSPFVCFYSQAGRAHYFVMRLLR